MITSGKGTNIAPIWSPDGAAPPLSAHRRAELRRPLGHRKQRRRRRRASPIRCRAAVDRSALVEPEFVHYPGPDGQQVPGWLFVPKNLDQVQKAPGDRLDSRRRHQPELQRLARAAELRRLLQLPSVPAAERLRRLRARLPRQHRLRPGLAAGRLHGRRRQGREGRVDGGELSEGAAVRRHRPPWRLGSQLRRLLHADRRDRSADALSRRGQRGRRRRLRDVLRGSVSRRLDREPDRHAGAEPESVRAGVAAVARRSAGAAAAGAARHVRRQRPVPALGAAH